MFWRKKKQAAITGVYAGPEEMLKRNEVEMKDVYAGPVGDPEPEEPEQIPEEAKNDAVMAPVYAGPEFFERNDRAEMKLVYAGPERMRSRTERVYAGPDPSLMMAAYAGPEAMGSDRPGAMRPYPENHAEPEIIPEGMRRCPTCGNVVPKSSPFCIECGADLPKEELA